MSQDSLYRNLGVEWSQIRSKILVALGSNIANAGNEASETVKKALHRLNETGLVIRKQSRLFQTPAYPPGIGPPFVNAVVEIETDQAPDLLMENLHRIEAETGRQRDVRWSPRVIDLDLLAIGDSVLPDLETQSHWRNLPLEDQMRLAPSDLILPHPRMQDRAFVLVPLRDIAPDWVHPVIGKSVEEMLTLLPDDDKSSIIPLE